MDHESAIKYHYYILLLFPVFCFVFEGQKVPYPASTFLPDMKLSWRNLTAIRINMAEKRLDQGLQTFLSKDHISYYTTVRGPDILRNLIASGYVKLYMLNSTKSISYK